MSDVPQEKTPGATSWLWPAAIVLCVIVTYINGMRGAFVLDDQIHIIENQWLRQGQLVDAVYQGRPLIYASLWVNHRIGGLNPANYHLLNIGVHAIAALALYGIARRTLLLRGRAEKECEVLAFAIAGIWAVHPLQTESVTYIIQRCESMMGMFFLLALYALIRGATSASAASHWLWYAASVVTFLLSASCKEVAIVFPVVALLYDGMFLVSKGSEVFKRRWGLYLAYLPGIAWLLLNLSPLLMGSGDDSPLSKGESVGLSLTSITPWMYLRSQPLVLLSYLKLSFWPDALCLDYHGMPVVNDPLRIYGYGLVILVLLGLSFYLYARGNGLGWLGLAWFAILAPTSSIVPTGDLMVEHRMYLPLAAVAALFVLGLSAAFSRIEQQRRLALAISAVVVIVALGARTILRNRDYVDPLHMWQLVVAQSPWNDRAHLNTANFLAMRGKLEEAEREYKRAIELGPKSFKNLYSYGVFLAKTGHKEEAIRHYKLAIEAWPGYPLPHIGQGNIAAREGRFADAVPHYRDALKVSPGHPQAIRLLADCLAKSGQFEESIKLCDEILKTTPGDAQAQYTLAWNRALANDAGLRDGAEAVKLAKRISEASRQSNADHVELLALAMAEAGQFSQAVASADKALDLAKEMPTQEPKRIARLEMLAESFRQRKAVHYQELKDKL